MKCLNCGIEIAVENASNSCPNCGSLDRSVAVADEAKVFEMLTVKQNVKSHHKYDGFMQAGERIGKNGKIARIRLEIDKKNRIKHHLVEEKSEKGEWVVVHDKVEHF